MSGLCEIFRLPKGAKVVLGVLSAVVFVLLVGVFALQSWTQNQVDKAQISFSKVNYAKGAKLTGGANPNSDLQIYAYETKVHFGRLEFLLRSKSISKINITNIAWSGIDSSAITSYESHNRRLDFTTTQQLNLDSGTNLGTMSYKMDFSPLNKTIIKYYVVLMILFTLALIFYNVFKNEVHRFFAFLQEKSLPQALWQNYKNINPLYRHTFWIVFIACNVVFGFDTAQFLWGRESWWSSFDKVGGNWAVAQGRWSQNAIYLLFTQDLILPFLNNFVAFFAFSVASILLCAYLNITRKVWFGRLSGLLLRSLLLLWRECILAIKSLGFLSRWRLECLDLSWLKKRGNIALLIRGGGGGAIPHN